MRNLYIAIAVGVVFTLVLSLFSSGGIKSFTKLHFWSFVLGAVSPAILFLIAVLTKKSDQPGVGIAIAFLAILLSAFVSANISLFLKVPTNPWWRFATGFILALLPSLVAILKR